MASLIDRMLPEAEMHRKAVAKTMKAIKAQFDVEYIGGVGFCGPRWQEAQAAWDAAFPKGAA